jgi:hypothetical protein
MYTVRCADPLHAAMIKDSDSSVRVVANQVSDPAIYLEGDSVTFTCPPGLILTGPSTSRCLGNGEWEPDLRTSQPTCRGACY